MWVVWEAWLAPSLVGCQILSCVDGAGHCLVGPGREVAGSGSLVSSGLVLAHWWWSQGPKDPGAIAYPWVGKIPWRRKWQHSPVFLPRESHGQRSLAGTRSQRLRHELATEHAHTLMLGPWCWKD